jgi:hypothetical protein
LHLCHFYISIVKALKSLRFWLKKFTTLVKAKIFHLEAPLKASEWTVSHAGGEKGKVGFSPEYFKQVVSHSTERKVVVVLLMPTGLPHELNCGQPTASQKPVPQIKAKEHNCQSNI